MKRRSLFTSGSALALGAVLPGCGSSSSSTSGTGRLRLLNACVGYANLGMTVDTSTTVSPVAFGSVSSYGTYKAGSIVTAITDGSTGSVVASQSRSVQSGVDYTLVAYGWATAVKTFQLTDGETAPGSGYAKFRILNAGADAGALSVYLTSATADLALVSPTIAAVGTDMASGFAQVTAGTYRLRVTGLGNTDDIRLDVSGVTINSTSILTLVVTPGTSGVLVQAMIVEQGGNSTLLGNAKARVRVVASVANNTAVQVTVGNTIVQSSTISPSIGNYVTLDSSSSVQVVVWAKGYSTLFDSILESGISPANIALAAGGDYTILVHGTVEALKVTVLTDLNRLPTVATNAKLRLVHGASALSASGMSLTVNYSALASNVAFGTSSNYGEVASSTNSLIEVTNPLAMSNVYSASGVTLTAGAVYTVFILMGTNGPVGLLRRER